MSSRILSSLTRSAPRLARSFPRARGTSPHPSEPTIFLAHILSVALPSPITRTYATEGASPGQASNVSNPQASSAESQSINKSASAGRTDKNDGDHASVQNPVSHPEESGIGGQEEPTESQDKMKHDPNKPDSQKKKETLEYGQNKPLDPADK